MSKLKALVLPQPSRLQQVCSSDTVESINTVFDARYNTGSTEFTKAEQDELLSDVDVLLTSWGSPVFDIDSLAHAPKLKYIGHAAGTVKERVPPEVFNKGVRVFSAAGRIAASVAEWCMGSLLCSLRLFPYFSSKMHEGALWPNTEKGRELNGLDIGLISMSSTARAFVPMLKMLNCDIVAYDPYFPAKLSEQMGVRLVSLEQAMSRTVVSVHLPQLQQTRRLITAEMLSLMPNGGIIINSSRGSVIDEAALIAELSSGRISAALDVFDQEPLSPSSPLRSLNTVLLTPHIAGTTVQGHRALMGCIVSDIIAAIEGRTTQYEVHAEHWDILA